MTDTQISEELKKRSGIARPGPKEFLLDFMTTVGAASLGIPMPITRVEALKGLAKDFRSIRKLSPTSRSAKLLSALTHKDLIRREGKTYKQIVKGLKNIPDKELERIDKLGLWRGVNDLDDLGMTYKLSGGGKERIKLRLSQPPSEAQKSLYHEFAHVAQPSKLPSEWKAENFAEAMSKRSFNKELGKILPEEYYDILKSMKMYTKPGY